MLIQLSNTEDITGVLLKLSPENAEQPLARFRVISLVTRQSSLVSHLFLQPFPLFYFPSLSLAVPPSFVLCRGGGDQAGRESPGASE